MSLRTYRAGVPGNGERFPDGSKMRIEPTVTISVRGLSPEMLASEVESGDAFVIGPETPASF
jgi:hypothetical protein